MRKRRQLQTGAEYHVSARINRGERILAPNDAKKLFMNILTQAQKKYKFQIKNFCIMNNHIHLIIKPGETESLSRIMQWILSVFAMRWNREHNLTGHVWGERFFSRIIAGILDYLRAFMYIDDNPVNAFLVDLPWQWEHGGLWHHRHGLMTVVDAPEPIVLQFLPNHQRSAR